MSENRQVAFRRINGRIVPIKINKQQAKDAAIGATLAGAGVGLSAFAGKAYRAINSAATTKSVKALRTFDKIEKMHFAKRTGQMTFSSIVRKEKAQNLAYKALGAGKSIGKFAAPVRIGGQILGAALVGVGVSKFLDSVKGKKLSKEQTSAIAGTAAVGAFVTGAHGGAGLRTTIKPLYKQAYPHIRKLKGLFKL